MRVRLLGHLCCLLLMCCSFQSAQAWTPTHRLKARGGQLYLRTTGPDSLLFAYRPGQENLSEIPDSALWSDQARQRHRGGAGPVDLELGKALRLSETNTVLVFMDPVRRTLSMEIRQDVEDGPRRTYRLDFSSSSRDVSASLELRASQVDHLYGLGEHMPESLFGEVDGDLIGTVRHSGASPRSQEEDPKGVYGNAMVPLGGGNVGNALFPSLMMLDDEGTDALLFLSNPADSRWDFRSSPWTVELRHGDMEGAFAWGREAQELRPQLLEWCGKPPVPPRKAFGLWVSEYGYESWEELESKVEGLRQAGFPLDGMVMDLQWFGGIEENSPDSRMGSLTFDLKTFPEPRAKLEALAEKGVGIVLIEEAYIAQNLPEYKELASRGFLVRDPENPDQPHTINEVPWWGLGSMLDYTNPEAGRYWHKTKREPLIDLGVLGHWTDLGEPEMFRHKIPSGRGKPRYRTPLYHEDREQLEMNNLFALSWARSIFNGYHENDAIKRRPFIVTRTGTSGIWRYGAAMWSGDIGSNWESLRSHYRAQSHIAMSGQDYFGSDVGGFYRRAYEGSNFDELYTRWFAAACLTDVPLRPHTMNLGNKFETAPHLVGDKASNLANLRQRYSLIPYLYSLAHGAWKEGESVIAPPALYSQGNGDLDVSGRHKMLGPDLLARLVLKPAQDDVDVLFPPGRWYDFESGRVVAEEGQASARVSSVRNGLLRTPLFARAGALIPVGSEQTSQSDPSLLEVRVFPGDQDHSFTLVEDDGWSVSYQEGAFATTDLRQSAWRGRYGQIVVGARQGEWSGRLPSRRTIRVHLATDRTDLRVFLGDEQVPVQRERAGFVTVELRDRPALQETVLNFR